MKDNISKRKVCFFSKSGKEQILREQYSIQDINILEELGYEVIIATKFSEIPWNCSFYFSWWASGSILPFIVALITRKPIIVVAGGNEAMLYKDSVSGKPKGYLATGFIKKIAVKTTLKFSNIVIVVSDFMKKDVLKLGARKVIKVYNSVNTDKFIPNNLDREEITTIFRFDRDVVELKRGMILIKAIPLVIKQFPNQIFTFIGGYGDALEEMKTLAKNLKVENNIRFINEIPNEEIVFWMQKSKIYVQISDTETFGVAVAEAMSCETPVLISKRGALPELVGNLGFYANHNNYQDVSKKLIKMLEMSTKEKKDLGHKLRKRILENFTFPHRKNEIEKIINEIAVK
uniref:glycosyltransferase n=1 Tax=uncultured Polaribacter sp. TaxID=174711 RepID=UPI002607A714|nr:glycosyltransferase [uncultured Polaribacter sp.]